MSVRCELAPPASSRAKRALDLALVLLVLPLGVLTALLVMIPRPHPAAALAARGAI
jgi:hypothetical protein